MWTTDIQAIPFAKEEKAVPFSNKPASTPIVKKSLFDQIGKVVETVKVHVNSPCGACNQGIPSVKSHIGIVYHNGYGLCLNDIYTWAANKRVDEILNAPQKPIKHDIVKKALEQAVPASKPFPFAPTVANTIPLKPF